MYSQLKKSTQSPVSSQLSIDSLTRFENPPGFFFKEPAQWVLLFFFCVGFIGFFLGLFLGFFILKGVETS